MRKGFWKDFRKHRTLLIMALPAFLVMLFISYVPLAGLALAFKRVEPGAGLFSGAWAGLDNFRFLTSGRGEFGVMARNTVFYATVFTALGTCLNVLAAVVFDRLAFRRAARVLQTAAVLPAFLSWAVVQFLVFAFLDRSSGIINTAFATRFRFYTESGLRYWPAILTVVWVWKTLGLGALIYTAALSQVDPALYEAAQLDGAGALRQVRHIALPALRPLVILTLLLAAGRFLRSDTGLHYLVTHNIGKLYPRTEVIDSYVLDALMKNSYSGYTAAAALFQSAVGLVLLLPGIAAARRLSPESALL